VRAAIFFVRAEALCRQPVRSKPFGAQGKPKLRPPRGQPEMAVPLLHRVIRSGGRLGGRRGRRGGLGSSRIPVMNGRAATKVNVMGKNQNIIFPSQIAVKGRAREIQRPAITSLTKTTTSRAVPREPCPMRPKLGQFRLLAKIWDPT